MLKKLAWILLIGSSLLVTGCGGGGWNINYKPPGEASRGGRVAEAGSTRPVITVHEFRDARPDQTRVAEINEPGAFGVPRTRIYNTNRPVGQVVTDAIEANLRAQGFEVVRSRNYLDTSNLSNVVTELVLGGQVRAFYVRQDDRRLLPGHIAGGTATTATVSILLQIATSEGTVIWEGDLIGSETREGVQILGFGVADPKALLEQALAGAVDQLHEPHIQEQLWSELPLSTKLELALLQVWF